MSETACGAWAKPGAVLADSIITKYGEIDDCEAIGGAWVVTTDEGDRGPGHIGIDVCPGDCAGHVPTSLSSWTWYEPSTAGYERLAGLNPDGTIIFIGAAGELAFDITTMTFSKESGHG